MGVSERSLQHCFLHLNHSAIMVLDKVLLDLLFPFMSR